MIFSALELTAPRRPRSRARCSRTTRAFWCLSSAGKGAALGLELIKDSHHVNAASAGSQQKTSTNLSDVLQCARARCSAKPLSRARCLRLMRGFWRLLSVDKGVALGLKLIKAVRNVQATSAGSRRKASTMPSDVLQCARARCSAKTAIASLLSIDTERASWCLLSADKGVVTAWSKQ